MDKIRDDSHSDEYWDRLTREIAEDLKKEQEEARLLDDDPADEEMYEEALKEEAVGDRMQDDLPNEPKIEVPQGSAVDESEDWKSERQGRGRPRAMGVANKAHFCAFLRAGLSRRQAAAEIGCHYKTILRETKRDPIFADDASFAERKGQVRPLLKIIQASQHSWRAAAWLMEHHRPINALSREERLDKDREVLQALKEFDGLLSETW